MAPPASARALLLGTLIEAIEIPRGLLHTGQSFEFLRPVAPGTGLTAELTVAQIAERRGLRLGAVDLELRDAHGACARGRASVLAPLPEASGGPA